MEEIRRTISFMQQQYTQQMAAFQEELQKSSTSSTTSTLAADFASFRTFIMNTLQVIQDQVKLLAHSVDKIEMESRRKILLFHGLPESKSEIISALVENTVVEKLRIADFSASSISRCHRMGSASSSKDKPRPILVKIKDLSLRNKIWFSKARLKGSGFTVSEFLTKTRHETFMTARERFGVKQCWSNEGTVFVLGNQGVRHKVFCLSDLDKINVPILKNPSPVGAAKHPVPAPKRRGTAVSKK